MTDNIIDALHWRYAVKIFDKEKKISDADLSTILESGRLAPSSMGIEPWNFIVVENPDIRAKLRVVGYDQPKITDASHIIVIARRTDVRETIADETIERTAKIQGVDPSTLAQFRQMLDGSMQKKSATELDAWIRAQTYIPLGMMIETAALLGIDTCPMEGFDPKGINEALGLAEKHLTATTMLALGYRDEDPTAIRPKVRRSVEDAIAFVK